MPNGRTNNSGCSKGSNCCPTCDAAHPCPAGQVCCNGKCVSGDCCANTDCLDPTKPICTNRVCRPCTSNAQCGNGKRCCSGQCKSGTCCTADDCADRPCQSRTCEQQPLCLRATGQRDAAATTAIPARSMTSVRTVSAPARRRTAQGKPTPAMTASAGTPTARASSGQRPTAQPVATTTAAPSATVARTASAPPAPGSTAAHLDDPCNRGVCQSDGTCAQQPRNNDEPCMAGANFCTDVGVCRDGACVVRPAVVCTASDECHAAGVCDPETGRCSNPTASNGTTCGNNGQCQDGQCVEPCLAVNAVCDPATDTCCDQEGEACVENAACSDAGEGRCCRPEGAFCEQPCDCCGGVCAGGVCCVPGQQCTSSNECCDGQECINEVCTSVCGTDRALCGGGMGTAPCCDGYQCVDGECWPGFCTPTTENCSSASRVLPGRRHHLRKHESSPAGRIAAAIPTTRRAGTPTSAAASRCAGRRASAAWAALRSRSEHGRVRHLSTTGNTNAVRVSAATPSASSAVWTKASPFPSRPLWWWLYRMLPLHGADGVCTCHRKGETCTAPGGNSVPHHLLRWVVVRQRHLQHTVQRGVRLHSKLAMLHRLHL